GARPRACDPAAGRARYLHDQPVRRDRRRLRDRARRARHARSRRARSSRGERMKIVFWGTRGSLPVALSAAAVRDKIAVALIRAAGRELRTSEAARAFVEQELSFAESATFGGNSACVQIET